MFCKQIPNGSVKKFRKDSRNEGYRNRFVIFRVLNPEIFVGACISCPLRWDAPFVGPLLEKQDERSPALKK